MAVTPLPLPGSRLRQPGCGRPRLLPSLIARDDPGAPATDALIWLFGRQFGEKSWRGMALRPAPMEHRILGR